MKYLLIIFTLLSTIACTPEEDNIRQSEKLQELGINDNGLIECIITQARKNDISDVTKIQTVNCTDIDISNLNGINNLIHLTSIVLNENKIEQIDISSHATLEFIGIYNQYELSSIDIEASDSINSINIHNVVLDYFWVNSSNEIDSAISIDIRDSIIDEIRLSSVYLSSLNFSNSYLESLKVKDATLNTVSLYLYESNIELLKFDNVQPIDEIYFGEDSAYGLTTITLSNMDNLKRILLPSKNIEQVFLNNLPSIESVILFGNNITNFKFGENVMPSKISFNNNPLSLETIEYLNGFSEIEVAY